MHRLPDLVPFLESLGFEFHLDYDDELTITTPIGLSGFDVTVALTPLSADIVTMVRRRASNAMHVCLGGPLDGQPHQWFYEGYRRVTVFRPVRVRRARWAAYEVQRDGRAFFRGYATSQKKARQGKLTAVVN